VNPIGWVGRTHGRSTVSVAACAPGAPAATAAVSSASSSVVRMSGALRVGGSSASALADRRASRLRRSRVLKIAARAV
jgi:hypothetical protein